MILFSVIVIESAGQTHVIQKCMYAETWYC